MTVAIQSPTVAGETNLASHLGQDSLNFLIPLSHVLQIMATVSAFQLGGLNVEVPLEVFSKMYVTRLHAFAYIDNYADQTPELDLRV